MHGYKTYVRNLKRDVNKKSAKTKKAKVLKEKKTFQLKDVEGEFQVNGRLSPGGTLRMKLDSDELEEELGNENEMYLSADEDEGSY